MHKTTYAPMIYTALCIMFWMRAYTFRGEGRRGMGPGIPEFLGPVKWERADRRVPFGAQKTREFQGPTLVPKKLGNSRAQPPPTSPSNGYAGIQNIMHRAV